MTMDFKSKLGNVREGTLNSMIYKSFYNEDIDESLVYLESRDGLDFTGNIFRIVEELSSGNYDDLKIHVHAKHDVVDKIKEYKKNYDLKIDKIITKESLATKTLEKAKYIFTDSGIRPKYVKKPGQIFVNTWHGTPLKLMGKYNIPEEYRVGHVQYVLMSSDYLIYPNDYMKDKMLDSYIIDKIYSGQILLEGYPRNSVFFDNEKRNKFKAIFNLENKEIFIYMPTFRGIFMDRDDEAQKDDVERYLSQLDVNLKDNQVLFAKLHVLNAKNIDFSKFKHIAPFPEGYETYDILNMADILITDYSSVFFDFANTGRKIILFNYDEDEFESYRGFYFPLSELPFPKVQNVEDLVLELNCPKNYDDSEFLTKFCTYDRPDAVKYLCNHIFNNQKNCRVGSVENKKENILIFAGSMLKNNITSSLKNLLSDLDCERYNFFITFKQWDKNIIQNHEEIIGDLPENVGFLPLRYDLALTAPEKNAYNKFLNSQKMTEMPDVLKKAFKRAYDRNFYSFNFKRIIDFEGYNNESLMFAHSGVKNAVWVHDNMLKEIHTRNIQNLNVLHEVYNNFDDICVVSKDLIQPTMQISNKSDNIRVISNFTSVSEDSEMHNEAINDFYQLLDEN